MLDVVDAGLLLVVALGVVLTLVGERRGDKRLQWVGKPAASAAFVALGALHQVPLALGFALALALVGDVLLIPGDERVFRLGVVAFLLAHVAYVVHFWRAGLDLAWLAGAAVALAALGALLARRFLPGVGAKLRPAVVPYILVITAMMAAALGTREARLIAPAALFYASDVLLAQHRFVRASWPLRFASLPLYYAGQVLFALS